RRRRRPPPRARRRSGPYVPRSSRPSAAACRRGRSRRRVAGLARRAASSRSPAPAPRAPARRVPVSPILDLRPGTEEGVLRDRDHVRGPRSDHLVAARARVGLLGAAHTLDRPGPVVPLLDVASAAGPLDVELGMLLPVGALAR